MFCNHVCRKWNKVLLNQAPSRTWRAIATAAHPPFFCFDAVFVLVLDYWNRIRVARAPAGSRPPPRGPIASVPTRAVQLGDGAQLESWKGRQQKEGSEEAQRARGEAPRAGQGRSESGAVGGVNSHNFSGSLTLSLWRKPPLQDCSHRCSASLASQLAVKSNAG